jgi:hypothetical protein
MSPVRFRDELVFPGLAKPVAGGGGASVLPDDRVMDGTARLAVPDDGGLALVRDPDRVDVEGWSRAFVRTSAATPNCVAQIVEASCSTQPGCGKICGNSFCATATGVPT